ncbi:bifunctional adenosylcobinamide kinase/adenosylcobinamide-phosphate guanylyltransferase [Sphingobium sp. LMA1-1-1.1]|uniref:bifunctional adenosylcobinamide kinase/adenosylcobinamide-phosphate guanylyltransferase n=1 Tax=unclassified Sphingobium TaxID=2611147 RepID=UPI003416FD6D
MLVLGGCRSGKSRFAQERCEAVATGDLAYVATAQAFDPEMEERIARHRSERGNRWRTIDAPMDLPSALSEAALRADAVMVDCLTLWLTNLMLAQADVAKARATLAEAIAACPLPVVLVSNEVGLGIVPDNVLARRFRDESGWLNQQMAALCDEVILMAAGLPLRLKG